MEAGKQLLLSADSGAEAVLQAELTEIQERWMIVSTQLEQQKKQLALLLKVSVQFLLYFFSKFVISHCEPWWRNALSMDKHKYRTAFTVHEIKITFHHL